MTTKFLICFALAISCSVCCFETYAQEDAQTSSSDWARWRGPTGNGIAAADQKPPVKWSTTENVIWKTKIPGVGHSSPIVLGGKIFLTTSDVANQTQSVICLNRDGGDLVWQKEVNRGGFPAKIHRKNTHASPTVATDGKHLFAVFNHHEIIELAKLDLDGGIVWKKKVGAYVTPYPFGYGSSPIVHGGNVIVCDENTIESAIVALDKESGKVNWRINRDGITSYSTPVVATIGGKEQLLLSGGKSVKSYDPTDGSENWSAPAVWDVTCGTLVWEGDLVFASGGFPANQTLAVNSSNGTVVWSNSTRVYEQSLLVVDGYVYAHADNSALYCWRAADGKEMWKSRFSKRTLHESVSPVLVNGNIHFTSENGETAVVKQDPSSFQLVSRNRLGDFAFATPAFCDNRIYARVGDSTTGQGHQWLYCLGEK